MSRLNGRDFTWRDDRHSAAVTIVNAELAHTLFPNGEAVGQRIRVGRDPARHSLEIVGIVQDAPVGNIRSPHVPVAFRPLLQEAQYARVPIVNMRTTGDAKTVADALRRAIAPFGRHYIRGVSTLEDQVEQSLLQERLVAGFAAFFAGVAVLLACVGLYGLLAYAVARRTREIGVRMALGATRGSVLQLIARDGARLAAFGIAIGIPCALAAGQFTQTLLYGLAPGDPATLVAASIAFVVIAIGAGMIPAYRASTIDPAIALRQD